MFFISLIMEKVPISQLNCTHGLLGPHPKPAGWNTAWDPVPAAEVGQGVNHLGRGLGISTLGLAEVWTSLGETWGFPWKYEGKAVKFPEKTNPLTSQREYLLVVTYGKWMTCGHLEVPCFHHIPLDFWPQKDHKQPRSRAKITQVVMGKMTSILRWDMGVSIKIPQNGWLQRKIHL